MTALPTADPNADRDAQIAIAFDPEYGEDLGEPDLGHDDPALYDQIIQLPPPILGGAERLLWQRCESRRVLGLPPASRPELLIRSVRNAVIVSGLGKKVSSGAIVIGTILAAAQSEGLKPRTPLRGIAKDLGMRYATLLTVRRIALAQIGRLGIRLGISIE
ncbi:MAG: hypothetical protein K0M70_02945 [Arenimonas sp.]|uniref:hypothetical protein n=1 Tax=Arenimonas sp. TaxID=1872635 RepID=UPI0025BA1A2A|nr:hypothetical protein [Arenimonas sp.]MBW8366799.1 hypothetical protein [Arenimonas sp.]